MLIFWINLYNSFWRILAWQACTATPAPLLGKKKKYLVPVSWWVLREMRNQNCKKLCTHIKIRIKMIIIPAGARVREGSPVSARPGVSAEHWTYKLLRGPGGSLSFLNFRARARNCRARSWAEENMMMITIHPFWYHDKNNVSWAVTSKENIKMAKPGL